jgi:hypothetical protein
MRVYLDIDIGDRAAWQEATDQYSRASDFLRTCGSQVGGGWLLVALFCTGGHGGSMRGRRGASVHCCMVVAVQTAWHEVTGASQPSLHFVPLATVRFYRRHEPGNFGRGAEGHASGGVPG